MLALNKLNVNCWIKNNVNGGTELKAETLDVVANFTVMWSFFECVLCKNRAGKKSFQIFIDRYKPEYIDKNTLNQFELYLKFYRERYIKKDNATEFNNKFNKLNFRNSEDKKLVEKVLIEEKNDIKEKLLALTLIIYRLRNNLFHGLKHFIQLNEQVESLTIATHCLTAILTANHHQWRNFYA